MSTDLLETTNISADAVSVLSSLFVADDDEYILYDEKNGIGRLYSLFLKYIHICGKLNIANILSNVTSRAGVRESPMNYDYCSERNLEN